VNNLTDGDSATDYLVWAGGGFGQDHLALDVYILGNLHLYNYTVFAAAGQPLRSSQSINFLDAITGVQLVHVADDRSPYLLVLRMEEEIARAFGGADDQERLQQFQRNLITAIQRAKGGG